MYTDDSGALGTFTSVELYFNFSKTIRPGMWVIIPEPSKSVLIMHSENIESEKRFGLCQGCTVCTGARCLEMFIRDDKSKHVWLKERTENLSRTSVRSVKPRVNTPRIFMPRWYTRSNKSGYLYGRLIPRSGEDAPENLFASHYLHKIKISLTHSRNSKYDAGQ